MNLIPGAFATYEMTEEEQLQACSFSELQLALFRNERTLSAESIVNREVNIHTEKMSEVELHFHRGRIAAFTDLLSLHEEAQNLIKIKLEEKLKEDYYNKVMRGSNSAPDTDTTQIDF